MRFQMVRPRFSIIQSVIILATNLTLLEVGDAQQPFPANPATLSMLNMGGFVPAGTEVFIPSPFNIYSPLDGGFEFYPTYINWLDSAFLSQGQWMGTHGSYYLPIEIDSDTLYFDNTLRRRRYEKRHRSRSELRDHGSPRRTVYIAKEYLSLTPDSNKLVVSETAPVLLDKTVSVSKGSSEGQAMADCNCNDPFEHITIGIRDLIESSDQHALERRKASYARRDKPFSFKNCPAGFDTSTLVELLKKQIDRPDRKLPSGEKIPLAFMLGIMENESNGDCSAGLKKPEDNGTLSVGLFQINQANFGRLSAAQIASPEKNIEMAVQILTDFSKAVYRQWKTLNIGDPSQETLLRLSLAAYGGGSGNALAPVNDLLIYNSLYKNRPELRKRDPQNWDDLKTFFFGREIKERGLAKAQGAQGALTTNRKTKLAAINAATVTTILGPPNSREGEVPSFMEQWKRRLKRLNASRGGE